MEIVNADTELGEEPVVQSRYSIVLATAKRARQIINGEKPLVADDGRKALSLAIDELYRGKIKIVSEGGPEED
jgi:DNA-directed RNA polymerase subunit omega